MLSFTKHLCFQTKYEPYRNKHLLRIKTCRNAGYEAARGSLGAEYGACKQIGPHSSKMTPLRLIRSPLNHLTPYTLPFLHSRVPKKHLAAHMKMNTFKVFYKLYYFNNMYSLKHFSIFAENLMLIFHTLL